MVGAGVSALSLDHWQRGRVTLTYAGASRVAARDRLGESMARLETATHGVFQGQTEPGVCGGLRRGGQREQANGHDEQCSGSFHEVAS